MIERRFVPMLKERDIPYSIDIFHTETDPKTIAEKICAEAEKLHVKAVVISHHQRSKLAEFFSVRRCVVLVLSPHPLFPTTGLRVQVHPKVLAPARDRPGRARAPVDRCAARLCGQKGTRAGARVQVDLCISAHAAAAVQMLVA